MGLGGWWGLGSISPLAEIMGRGGWWGIQGLARMPRRKAEFLRIWGFGGRIQAVGNIRHFRQILVKISL